MESISVIKKLFKAILDQKAVYDENKMQIGRIQMKVRALGEAIKDSGEALLSKQPFLFTLMKEALTDTLEKIKKANNRSFIYQFCGARSISQSLNEAMDTINDILQNTQQQNTILLSGRLHKVVESDKHRNELLKSTLSPSALQFWQKYFSEKKEIALSFNEFNSIFVSTAEFKQTQADPSFFKIYLMEILDYDNDGIMDLDEFNKFFQEIWDNEEQRNQFIERLNWQNQKIISKWILTNELLKESNCDNLFSVFVKEKIDCQNIQKLNNDVIQCIKIANPQIPMGDLLSVLTSVEKYKAYKNYFFNDLKPKAEEKAKQAKQLVDQIEKDIDKYKNNNIENGWAVKTVNQFEYYGIVKQNKYEELACRKSKQDGTYYGELQNSHINGYGVFYYESDGVDWKKGDMQYMKAEGTSIEIIMYQVDGIIKIGKRVNNGKMFVFDGWVINIDPSGQEHKEIYSMGVKQLF